MPARRASAVRQLPPTHRAAGGPSGTPAPRAERARASAQSTSRTTSSPRRGVVRSARPVRTPADAASSARSGPPRLGFLVRWDAHRPARVQDGARMRSGSAVGRLLGVHERSRSVAAPTASCGARARALTGELQSAVVDAHHWPSREPHFALPPSRSPLLRAVRRRGVLGEVVRGAPMAEHERCALR